MPTEQPISLTAAQAAEYARRHRGRVIGAAMTLLALAAIIYALALVRL
ncbi:hypothetical protein [Nguyenibacter sp. L1]|nr:hypothetical protein [Nguyenibacter sp. L1]WRH88355.1 hypothetical protein QN315_01555 [Nguyenibacter sp. L1]